MRKCCLLKTGKQPVKVATRIKAWLLQMGVFMDKNFKGDKMLKNFEKKYHCSNFPKYSLIKSKQENNISKKYDTKDSWNSAFRS